MKGLLFLLFLPFLSFGQNEHLKFYERVQIVPEFQIGIYNNYKMVQTKPTSPPGEVLYKDYLTTAGVNLIYKNRFVSAGGEFLSGPALIINLPVKSGHS